MRRPRFRIRTMMIAVAVAAMVLAGGIEARRLYKLARYFRQRAVRAAFHRDKYADGLKWKRDLVADREVELSGELSKQYRSLLDKERRHFLNVIRVEEGRIRYYSTLSSRYERAARYPWLPVEPDPPMPE